MEITLNCDCDQALWMAKREFEESGDYILDMITIKRKGSGFVIPIEDQDSKAFLEFVQGNQKREKRSNENFYSDHFKTSVRCDSVRGFISQECLVEAIDAFNQAQMDYYIDPCISVAEIATDKGIIFVPEINDLRLERLFWDYVNKYCDLKGVAYCIVTGNEVL